MEKEIKELQVALELCRKKCPWAAEQSIANHSKELVSEAIEFRQAVEKNDAENMKEEFGDTFWDLLFIGVIAEEKQLFSAEEALADALEKLKRRKPWVFGKEKIKTAEEAVKRWNEIKKLEKKPKK